MVCFYVLGLGSSFAFFKMAFYVGKNANVLPNAMALSVFHPPIQMAFIYEVRNNDLLWEFTVIVFRRCNF